MVSTQESGAAPTTVLKLKPKPKLVEHPAVAALAAADRQLVKLRLTEGAECVYNTLFDQPDAERQLVDAANATGSIKLRAGNDDSGLDWLAGASTRALTTDEEQAHFLRFNYLRYRVYQIIKSVKGATLDSDWLRDLIRWERAVRAARDEIIRANIPLVLAMSKRTKITGVDPADLISEGNLALLRSVDKFDCSRGYKFSTYACRAILKSFSRVAARTSRYRGYFPTEFDPTLEKSDELALRRDDVEERCIDELKSILGQNLARLNDVEEKVIRARFMLDEREPEQGTKGKTLEQVGEMIGVTKERVRQIQNKALGKLRVILEEGILAV